MVEAAVFAEWDTGTVDMFEAEVAAAEVFGSNILAAAPELAADSLDTAQYTSV